MAPFSICSQCSARTRKVVKDPKTHKEIYLCPVSRVYIIHICIMKINSIFYCQKCCKAKEEEAKQLVSGEYNKRMGKTRLAPQPEESPPPSLLASPTKCPINQLQIENPYKPTPPIMQIVVINGRKYIAISATAPDK